ncbi:hypothetical protein EK904_000788 [Melospiza melodia maxima]|nr:hypothetical protein EK904_000788 [Melospiza melodia maxima]
MPGSASLASPSSSLSLAVNGAGTIKGEQVPKGGSVPPATEITKPPVVPQAQERKPQVAYKTEIVGGVVVHTPISINQV